MLQEKEKQKHAEILKNIKQKQAQQQGPNKDKHPTVVKRNLHNVDEHHINKIQKTSINPKNHDKNMDIDFEKAGEGPQTGRFKFPLDPPPSRHQRSGQAIPSLSSHTPKRQGEHQRDRSGSRERR